MHDRDAYWSNRSRKSVKIKDMNDSYLVNTSFFVKKRDGEDTYLSRNMIAEIEYRGITQDFIEMAPFSKEEWDLSVEEIKLKRKMGRRFDRLKELGITG